MIVLQATKAESEKRKCGTLSFVFWSSIYCVLYAYVCVRERYCSSIPKCSVERWPGASKAEGLEFFYPIINMTEERATAPKNWTEPPVSCCGQRAPHYPQCTTGQLHQRHNTMFTPCLYWIGLRLSFSLFFFLCVQWIQMSDFKTKTNKYNTHVSVLIKLKASLSH